MSWSIENGTYYISRNGNDVNSGSTEFPLKTITEAISRAQDGDKIVLGSNQYLTLIDLQNKSLTLEADGWVELSDQAEIVNPGLKTILIGLQIKTVISGTFKQVNRCSFFNATINNLSGILYHCLFSNSDIYVSGICRLVNDTIENTSISLTGAGTISQCLNTHLGNGSFLELVSSGLTEFNYCNIQTGSIVQLDEITFTELALIKSNFPQFLIQSSSLEPKFGSEDFALYTLAPDSPLISSGKLGKFVGAFNSGIALTSLNNGFIANDHLRINTEGFYEFVNGVNSTILTSNVMQFNLPESLETIHLSAIQCFILGSNSFASESTTLPNGGLDFKFRSATNANALLQKEFETLQWNSSPLTTSEGSGFGSQRVLFFQLAITLQQESLSRFLLKETSGFILKEDLSKITI